MNALFETLKSYVDEKGFKTGYVMWPIRTAVSGKQSTPVEQQRLWRFSEKKSLLREFRKVLNYWKDKGSL